jgi:hypothetical protein
MLRLTAVAAAALAFALAPAAFAKPLAGPPTPFQASSGAPTGLRAFLLSPSEARATSYPRTPSFAWNPIASRGGTYDFELATNRTFNDSSVLFSYTKLRIPAVSVAHQLPWMTGVPYALWAHVRWTSANGKTVTQWSQAFGFNMRWRDSDYPQQLSAPEGLIRWKPIEGATRYQVMYPDISYTGPFETTTNVADEREFFTLRTAAGWGAIHWRVRAVRYSDAAVLKNGLPVVSYGPWSRVFTSVNPPESIGILTPQATVSDTWDTTRPQAHDLTPGFAWAPSAPIISPQIGSVGGTLYRVYVATDDHCVNVVYRGSIVGSPAWAPRASGGTLKLPQSVKDLPSWTTAPYLIEYGSEGHAFDATGAPVVSNEATETSSSSGTSAASTGTDAATSTGGGFVDLWDSGWPTGRFYWTVVPVRAEPFGALAAAGGDQAISYRDAVVPQDECEAGFGKSFGKVSAPVVTQQGTPWVSGLSPDGRMVASAQKVPTVHDSPLVAWEPAVGAATYELQLSRKSYPWVKTWSTATPATSAVLPLGPTATGTWWYRVRGINPALPKGAQAMSWSKPVRIRVTGDSFVVVK